MNRIDSSSPPLIYSESHTSPFQAGPVPAHRLLVLVSSESDCASATRRIADLAHPSGAGVLFLGLCKGPAQQLDLHRQLITLSALLEETGVGTESTIEIGTNWVESVKSNYRDGDLIVCPAEERAGLLRRPLSQLLQSNLQAPIYILSSSARPHPSQSTWLPQTLMWTGSLGIILGFFVLQLRLTSLPQDWIQTTLLILSVIAEAWLLGVWNSLFG